MILCLHCLHSNPLPPAVDQSGVATPRVWVEAGGVALDSFSAHYCAPRSAAVSLHCRAAIEQGRDLSMQWLQLQVGTLALVSLLSYIIGIDCRPPTSLGQDTSLGKYWG